MLERIIVSGIIQNDEKILLGKKAKGAPPYPDVWHLIGGGIEFDLSIARDMLKDGDYNNIAFHEELLREITEESQVEVDIVRNICPYYRDTPRTSITENSSGQITSYVFLEYFCIYKSGIPVPGDDIAELRWFDKSELSELSLTPPSIEMYNEIGWL